MKYIHTLEKEKFTKAKINRMTLIEYILKLPAPNYELRSKVRSDGVITDGRPPGYNLVLKCMWLEYCISSVP